MEMTTDSSPQTKLRGARMELIEEMKCSAADSAPSSDVALEVTNYLTMRHLKTISNPLSFWCERQKTFHF